MFCKSCGKEIDNDSMFCSFCGIKQSTNLKPQNQKNINHNVNTTISQSYNDESNFNSIPNIVHPPKYDPTYKKENDALIVGIILLLIPLIFSIISPIKFENRDSYEQYRVNIAIASLIIRICITIWIVNIAKRQNREPWGWGLFAFLLPSISLIVIATRKKLYPNTQNMDYSVNENSSEIDNTEINYVSSPIQTVYRETTEDKLLKIVSKHEQTIGAEVFIDDVPAPDGVYYYKSRTHKLIIENGKIKERYFIEKLKNIVIEKTELRTAQIGDKVFLDTGDPAPTGKYSVGFMRKLVVENGLFVRYE